MRSTLATRSCLSAPRAAREALAEEVWNVPRMALFFTPESQVVLVAAIVAVLVITTLINPIAGGILALMPVVLLPMAHLVRRALKSQVGGKALPRGTPTHVLLPRWSWGEKPLRGHIRFDQYAGRAVHRPALRRLFDHAEVQ